MLELFNPFYPLPPASVAKAVTTAYGLDRLGPGYRFPTRLVTDGTIIDGRLEGDLWLVGGGDPVLDTDALDAMARDLVDSGIRQVTGAFRVAADALPAIDQIDPGQLPHVGYNPSISALNLNFNRVFFEWERTGEDYTVRMDARSDNHSPSVTVSRMTVEARDYPVYTFHRSAAWDEWTVARSALGNGGGRWLPVRRPPDYLAEVFQMLARDRGIALGTPVISEKRSAGCAGGRRIREPTAGGHPARHDALVDEPHRRGRGAVGHAGGRGPSDNTCRKRGRDGDVDARAAGRAAGSVRGPFGPRRGQQAQAA